jgi:hypothetical protein
MRPPAFSFCGQSGRTATWKRALGFTAPGKDPA